MTYARARCAAAALIALSAIAFAQPAAAQGAAPAAAPTPAAMLIAKQIVDLKDVKDVFQPIVRGVVQKTRDMFMQTNFMWGKDLNEIAANLQKEYDPRVNELVDASARIYAMHFSEAELKQLLAFYQSPIGQKALVEEPKVLDESMINAGTWATNLSTNVIDRFRDEMKKRGHDM
jgi:hypothetical protein